MILSEPLIKNISYSKLSLCQHILLIELDRNSEDEFSKKFVYSKGSACLGGIMVKSNVYNQIYPDRNIIRISF